MKDLYSILGVPRDADSAAIKKAFKTLARQYHPDVSKEPDAEKRFKEVSAAHEVLGDDDKRKLYDEFGEVSLRPGFDPEMAKRMRAGGGGFPGGFPGGGFGGFQGAQGFDGGFSFEDLFGNMDFVRRGGPASTQGRSRAAPARDIEGEVQVPFLDAVRGGETTVQISGPDGVQTLNVKIPAGIRDGQVIRVRGKGEASRRGGAAGDLMLTARVGQHPLLRRDGNDLELDLPVRLAEAVGGATIEVPTPKGTVRMKVPAGSTNGRRLRIPGHGVQAKDAPGDLYLVIRPVLPSVSDEEALKLASALDARATGDVRAGLSL